MPLILPTVYSLHRLILFAPNSWKMMKEGWRWRLIYYHERPVQRPVRPIMLLLVGVVSKVSARPPTSTSVEPTLSGDRSLKIGRINYLSGLTKRVKFQIGNHSGSSGRWGDTNCDFSYFHAHGSHGAPNSRAH